MTDPRLSQSDVNAFVTTLQAEVPAGHRLWLTLLDDASPGQLRVRKLNMVIRDEPASGESRRSREWYSTSAVEDRWEEIDNDVVLSSAEVLAIVKTEFMRASSIPSKEIT